MADDRAWVGGALVMSCGCCWGGACLGLASGFGKPQSTVADFFWTMYVFGAFAVMILCAIGVPIDECLHPEAAATVWDAVFEGVFDNHNSFGVKQLQLYSRLSTFTSLPTTPACQYHSKGEWGPTLGMKASFQDDLADVMAGADKQVLKGTVNGGLFTSTMPENHSSSCIPYPTQQATFCSALGHSHRVVSSFSDPNFAQQRSTNLELVWQKIKNTDVMSNLADKSAVCLNSVKDGLCIEAFPMCSELDLTACMMTCRNMVACVDELIPGVPDDIMDDLNSRVHKCQGFCKQATGLSIMEELGQKFSVYDEGDATHLPQRQPGVLGPLAALVLSMATMTPLLCISRRKHVKLDGNTDECSDEESPMMAEQPKA